MMRITKSRRTLLIFAVTLLLVDSTLSQSQCSLPNATDIGNALQRLLLSDVGEGSDIQSTLIDFHFTCLAVEARDLYRAFSIAVSYNTNDQGSTVLYAQIQLECTSGNNIRPRSVLGIEANLNRSVFSITTRRDCRTCTADANIPNLDADANCLRECRSKEFLHSVYLVSIITFCSLQCQLSKYGPGSM